MRNSTLLLMLAVALALSACKKDDDATNNTATPSGLLGQAADKAKAEGAAAALPQPDASKPLSSYRKLGDNNADAMFLYQAVSSLPPDYEKAGERHFKGVS